LASRRYARAISSRDAVRGTPRTAYGSNSVTTPEVYAATLAILSPVIMKRVENREPVEPGDPNSTIHPAAADAAAVATVPSAADAPIDGAQLYAASVRALLRFPNQTVHLAPMAEALGVKSDRVQLAVEGLARRRMVVAPFIEPGAAGGATLTSIGLRWLIAREGGSPADTPTALLPAQERVRAEDEAARLPRAQVYGVTRRE
jgi:hypothetical protein